MRPFLKTAGIGLVLVGLAACRAGNAPLLPTNPETAESVFQQIREWTTGVTWTESKKSFFGFKIYGDTGRVIPTGTLAGKSMRGNTWDPSWYPALDEKVRAGGWAAYPSLSVDGVVSLWGYAKKDGDVTRFLVFTVEGSNCTVAGIEKTRCKHHLLGAFYSDPVQKSQFVAE